VSWRKGYAVARSRPALTEGTRVVGVPTDLRARDIWTPGTGPGAVAGDLTKILDEEVPGP
jgi:hypothetical protein